jgi:4'-phosphopantetheinyl transferase EntD
MGCQDVKDHEGEVYVYYAPLCQSIDTPLYPKERQAEVDRASSPAVKLEKYTAWRLLEYALTDAYSLKLSELSVKKSDTGAWVAPGIYFSISHSGSLAAVSLSMAPTGVDLERKKQMKAGIEARILCPGERAVWQSLPAPEKEDYLLLCWTKKEAIFKTLKKSCFHPQGIDSSDLPTYTMDLTFGGEDYLLTLAYPANTSPRVSVRVVDIK